MQNIKTYTRSVSSLTQLHVSFGILCMIFTGTASFFHRYSFCRRFFRPFRKWCFRTIHPFHFLAESISEIPDQIANSFRAKYGGQGASAPPRLLSLIRAHHLLKSFAEGRKRKASHVPWHGRISMGRRRKSRNSDGKEEKDNLIWDGEEVMTLWEGEKGQINKNSGTP